MNVCHIWHNFLPAEFGGLERYILNLSDFLSRQDQNNHFFLLTDKSQMSFLRALKTSDHERVNSLEVFRLGPNLSSIFRKVSYKLFDGSPKPLDNLVIYSLYKEATLIRELEKVDIFHVHGLWQSIYPTLGLLLSQSFHRPLVLSLHGDSIFPADKYAMMLNGPRMLSILQHADAITTFSKEILLFLNELGLAEKAHLVPNFINAQWFKRPVSNNLTFGKQLILVSRLDSFKNPLTAVRAFSLVQKEIPEATLQIVGYGPLIGDIERLIENLNLKQSVTLVGMKKDVREFLWNSDIFIGTRSSYIATLEAWAAGLAVITPSIGILRELITDGTDGLLVSPNDAKQLASSIIRLMKDPNLRLNLVSKGIETSKKHDISNIAPQIADIYLSLLPK